MPVKFKKGVEVENGTRIKIKKGFENFYKKGFDTIFYMQINEFEVIDDKINEYNAAAEDIDDFDLF